MTLVAADEKFVYLLGAGLSRAVSDCMPVMLQLGRHVLALLELPANTLQPHNGDLEAWLSYLAAPQPWLRESENLTNRALFMQVSETIFKIINDAEQDVLRETAPAWLLRLGWQMSLQHASVLTFNYDLLLERACMTLHRCTGFTDLYASPLMERRLPGTGVFLSRNPPSDDRIMLHKLHGSTNWLTSGQTDSQQASAYVVRNNGVWSADSTPFIPDRRYADLQPMVIPPVANKTALYGNQALRATWMSAADALRNCTRLVIIGYSFPLTDGVTRAMVTASLPASAQVTIVDTSTDKCRELSTLLGNERTTTYSGSNAVTDFVNDHCPHLIEHGVTLDLNTGIYTPHLLIDNAAYTEIPHLDTIDGPPNFPPDQQFSRWVGQNFPGATSTGIRSTRFPDLQGGIGFAVQTEPGDKSEGDHHQS